MIVEATTPSRVDLAGGTLDIWPLYLLLGGGITVNCALSMGSYVRLTTRRDRKIRIHSEDTGERLRPIHDGTTPECGFPGAWRTA